MAISDLFKRNMKKAGSAAEKAAETVETVENDAGEAANEAQEFLQEHMPPEPPKDENGSPIRPPEGMRPPFGGRPPEPPKDENGNPIKPPEGMKPPFGEAKESVEKAGEEAAGTVNEAAEAFQNGRPPMGRPPMGMPPMGGKPPEPPKDENGNPIKPPEGMRPPFGMKKPEENESGTEN